MNDRATSDDIRVQAQLDRLTKLSPGRDILGLERISALLKRLGDPQRRLPPVLHVAGTNGKGSTCAFLRSALESGGLTTHVYTSPHLVRFNERIRLCGRLIEDDALASLLEEVLDRAEDMEISFFEATTAAALLAFSRVAADACVVEVGLGGRLDATNVIGQPAACGIAQLGMDHHAFLGDRLEQIAAEKAGIAKRGVPLVTQAYPEPIAEVIRDAAAKAGAEWLPRGESWDASETANGLDYHDQQGTLHLPLPKLSGRHQCDNAALAIAMLRHQNVLTLDEQAIAPSLLGADWPARLQRLSAGPLTKLLPTGSEIWLDGAHNPAAASAVAAFFAAHYPDQPSVHLVIGLLSNKDAAGVIGCFAGRELTLHAVPVPGHEHHAPEELSTIWRELGLMATTAGSVQEALADIARTATGTRPPIVLIMGSLYLAGEVLKANGQSPT